MKRSGGAAGVFVLLGILTILAVTFFAGTYTGRIWANRPRVLSAVSPAEREPARRGAETRASRVAEPAPRLTFYQELTAPLTPPPPPPKPAKTSPPPLVTSSASKPAMPERSGALDMTHDGGATTISSRAASAKAGLASPAATVLAAPATTAPTAALALPAATTGRFTIQVAAYRQRPQADALRATLAAAGHDARVVENDAANGVRYRVQIGDFASRDAARDAATRFNGPTFVTTR